MTNATVPVLVGAGMSQHGSSVNKAIMRRKSNLKDNMSEITNAKLNKTFSNLNENMQKKNVNEDISSKI